MANDRLYILCSCGGPTAMLAKLWGDGGEAWDEAAQNLDLFFEAHQGCSPREYALAFERDVVDLPSVHDPVTVGVRRRSWRATLVYTLAYLAAMAVGIVVSSGILEDSISAARWGLLVLGGVVYGLLTPPLAAWGRRPKP